MRDAFGNGPTSSVVVCEETQRVLQRHQRLLGAAAASRLWGFLSCWSQPVVFACSESQGSPQLLWSFICCRR